MGYVILSVVCASVCAGIAVVNGVSAQGVIATYILSGTAFLILSMILESYDE